MSDTLKQYRSLLVKYVKPQWRKALILALLLLLSIGLQLVNPQILRRFIDTALEARVDNRLGYLALLYLGVALLNHLAAGVTTYVGADVGWTATNQMRADLALHCMRLDMSFHNTRTPGEMIERIDGDVTALSNFFSQFVIRLFGNGILLLGVLGLLFREDWRVGAAFSVFSLVSMVTLTRIRDIAVPHWEASRQASAEMYGFLEERLAGTEDIRSAGATAYVMRRLYEAMRKRMLTDRAAWLMGSVMWNSTIALFAFGHALAFALGAYLFQAGSITIGTVYLLFHYAEVLRRPLEQITRQMEDLQKATAGIARINELYDTRSKIGEGGNGVLPAGALSVEFDNVEFAYHEDDPVLRDFNFRLEAGHVLGLLGRTGSGKTTITRLLFRLYDTDEGAIRLGGHSLREVRLADLRHRIGMVTQDVQLFHATVRDNLTLFDDSILDERILHVLEELGLWPWYESLADGLDTELASCGGGLSAGEAQLLALTRVFLKDPGLVIMDEATSRLDPATQTMLERAVDKLLAGRTGIVVAHRLATVDRADNIMIIDHGRIAEHGRRNDLLRDPESRFVQLLHTGLEEELV